MNGHKEQKMQEAETHHPCADLDSLDFVKLIQRDPLELSKLLDACEKDGFFYLNLEKWKNGGMISQHNATHEIMRKWFKQPNEEKLKTETLSDAHGYKPIGVQSGPKEGSRDGFEALRISRTAMLSGDHLPEVARENADLFRQFQFNAHEILKTLLVCLSDAANIREMSKRFESYHSDGTQSKSTLFFLHHPVSKEVKSSDHLGHNAHTDVGSFTFLFARQWGLQVFAPAINQWQYVRPISNCAIINVADTLRFISGKRFRSAMHRVLPPTGTMEQDRYSTAYFLRAGDDTMLKSADGTEISAGEWFLKKYSSFNQATGNQHLNGVATGEMDTDLGVTV